MKIIVEFMDENPSLATGYKPNTNEGRNLMNKLWDELVIILNANGPPIKDNKAWRKVRTYIHIHTYPSFFFINSK